MKMIKELSEMIEDELEGAEEYIEDAIKQHERDPELSAVLYEISTEEMRHINMLHEQVARLIQRYRKEHGEPPAAMQAVYDHLHERHVEHATKIKLMQSHYRESMK